MIFRADKGCARADRGYVADELAEGAELLGAGVLTTPDGTQIRPGCESVTAAAAAGTTLSHGASKAQIIYLNVTHAAGVDLVAATPEVEAGSFDRLRFQVDG